MKPHVQDLQYRMNTTAFAFRGYNITNLGKSPELLAHDVYGPMVEKLLQQASEISSDILQQQVDLVSKVRNRDSSSLKNYSEDIAFIVGMELIQLKLLEEFFEIPFSTAQLAFGYSLGEISSLIAGEVYPLEDILTTLLSLSEDTATLAHNVTMGILFSRGAALDLDLIEKKCLKITNQGQGVIDISSYLSPNTVLLLGENDTIDEFKKLIPDTFPSKVHLKKNKNHWPPLHTQLTWKKSIPNRAGVLLETASGGFKNSTTPLFSCVTGDLSYNDFNSRELILHWIDHPQQLWKVIDKVLAMGVEAVIHVGPEPNIIPATFSRLSNNVTTQLSGRSLTSLGLRAVSRIVRRRRPWLTRLLSSDTTLLRAPFVEHIILEDWLLEQDFDKKVATTSD